MATLTIKEVPLRTPHEAIFGDLGWLKFWVRGDWQGVCMWTRITTMNEDSLTRKAMCVQRDMVLKNHECWLNDLHSTLCSSEHGKEIWDKWWLTPNFALKCSNTVISQEGNKITTEWGDEMKTVFTKKAEDDWLRELNRPHAWLGEGGNKL